jgi:hypothetical protein
MKQKHVSIEHRRSLLMQEISKGHMNQRKLALRFHVSPATINRDLECIAKEAADNLDSWVDKKIPFAYKYILVSSDLVLRKVWEQYERHEGEDDRLQLERLQFIAALNWQKRNLLMDYGKIALELTTHQKIPLTDPLTFK